MATPPPAPLERVCREAPVFRPTPEEFAEPLRYIASIREDGEHAGICRIIPPQGWDVPLALSKTASFPVTVQPVTELQQRLRSSQAWRTQYSLFLQQCGEKIPKQPIWGGRPLDLWALYNAVSKRGGYSKVCAEGRWKEVARTLQALEPSVVLNTTASLSLRTAYERHLVHFEQYDAAGDIPPLPEADAEPDTSTSEPANSEENACAAALVDLEDAVPADPPEPVEVDELDGVSAHPSFRVRGPTRASCCIEPCPAASVARLESPQIA